MWITRLDYISVWVQYRDMETHEEHETKQSAGDELRNINAGKSECCVAEVGVSGGGYDGEDIVPISEWCTKCGQANPKIIQSKEVINLPF